MEELPVRKLIRLKGYDYSRAGAYFVTICTYNREHLLGYVVGAGASARPHCTNLPVVVESEIGQIARTCWDKINDIYEYIKTDKFCIMPNHIHGIIWIERANENQKSTGGQRRPPLHRVLQSYKSITTRMCFRMGHQKIWQRSYHDHIIRNKSEYQRVWQYIDKNPATWNEDYYHTK